MKITLEPDDYEEIRGMCMGNIDFVPTDAQIDQAVEESPYLAAQAQTWGWNDTEVRDGLCEKFEELA